MTDPQYPERNGMYIGQGITKFSRAGMFRASEGIAVEMTHRVYRLPSFHSMISRNFLFSFVQPLRFP